MMPLFSATKTRPSEANSTDVGLLKDQPDSPPLTTWSAKNGSTGAARAGTADGGNQEAASARGSNRRARRRRVRHFLWGDSPGSPLAPRDPGDRGWRVSPQCL